MILKIMKNRISLSYQLIYSIILNTYIYINYIFHLGITILIRFYKFLINVNKFTLKFITSSPSSPFFDCESVNLRNGGGAGGGGSSGLLRQRIVAVAPQSRSRHSEDDLGTYV